MTAVRTARRGAIAPPRPLDEAAAAPIAPMRIAIVSDAWHPQVNGVVRTLETTIAGLQARGHTVLRITPELFSSVAVPFYREIRLAIAPGARLARMLDRDAPDIVHIATEGPLGWAARRWCLRRAMPFTTAFHTRFPDYAAVRTGLSAERFWPIMRRFHAPSHCVLAATRSLRAELAARKIGPTAPWSRGIDQALFRIDGPRDARLARLPGPVLLHVGRVAAEKNIAAFLCADHPGTKVVVGDGPALASLKARFPQAVFTGKLHGEDLAAAYRAADCLVFPSRSDTFGLVMIEALACGVPVAGFPVAGPLDIVGAAGLGPAGRLARPVGAVHEDLARAIAGALTSRREDCAAYGRHYTWLRATAQFETALAAALPLPAAHAA